MLKVSNSDENTKKGVTTRYFAFDSFALDGARFIPLEDGGGMITSATPSITVNEMGKQLLKAAAEGNLEETRSLLNRGALFTADWLGTSPLHFAARNNNSEICEVLLRAGISKDARTKVDKTSLHMAAYEGHVNIVETLLEYGADPDCRDLLGMTPLHWAAQNGHIEVVKVLLKHRAQTDPMNKFELSPADLAAQINRLDIVELINIGISEPAIATQHLTLQLAAENSDESTFQATEEMSPSASSSPIPLETILMEGNDGSIDPERLHLNNSSDHSETDNEFKQNENSSFLESMKLLQEHGITMLPNDDNNILTTVMETGHSVVLTEVGKEVLNSVKESERNQNEKLNTPITKKKIITVTPEEFLAMTSNATGNKTNILKQINGRLVPKNIKRIVMKKNKVIPISSSINNVFKINNKTSNSSDMETVMRQLIEANKTIEEYKLKLSKKEEEAEKYKQQLKFLMDES